MEQFFSYETAKQTIVLTAYWALLVFNIWWIGYLLVSLAQWIFKNVKKLLVKIKEKLNQK